jgi:hypothetical protein
MPTAFWILLALGAGCLLAAALWWRHRQRIVAMERQLAWSEASRFELEHQVKEADLRLMALHQALQGRAEPGPAAPPPVWAETQPFTEAGFASTVPADLPGRQPPR